VVQVDPIKPTLKALGTRRFKPISDEPLSNLALDFNLRRYTMGVDTLRDVNTHSVKLSGLRVLSSQYLVRRCRFTLLNPR